MCPAILVWIPCKVLRLQGKEARLSAEIGLIIGAVAGWFIGIKVADFIVNIIYGDMSKYSIRIDLGIGALLGASIFSSIGAVVGGRISRRRKEKNNTYTISGVLSDRPQGFPAVIKFTQLLSYAA